MAFAVLQTVYSQNLSNIRVKKITVLSDTVAIDSLSIIPGTLMISSSNGDLTEGADYIVDYANAEVFFRKEVFTDTLLFAFRVFPLKFSAVIKHKDENLVNNTKQAVENPFLYRYETVSENVFQWGSISKNGSISRGISFGNNQDVVVNSSLNLQLSGNLSGDIQVLAAITDNNIPIQPDGNTQQLQEFDKVFIQLFNKNNKLIVGDFELEKPKGYFMNFYKKGQGAVIESNLKLTEKTRLFLKGSGAASKGRYARNVLVAMEGNQGPYKLTGSQNELFIMVIAGTEKVYIDGRILTRGQDNDYVIDYNTGEITFMPKNLITKDKRIVVEFEYSDKNYARTMFYAGAELEYKNLNVRFNFITEQDLKNQPIQQDLTEEDKQILALVGDSVMQAIVPNIDSMAFSNNYIMYKLVDTVVNFVHYDSVFIYSTNPDSAFYRLGFSYVGKGKGNYIQIQNVANGKVFKWIAPESGNLSGEYEPVMLLYAPTRKQLYTLGVDYSIGKTTKISVETALSNNNKNTFSDFNKQDDYGYAVKATVNNVIPFGKKNKNGWKYLLSVSNEWIDKKFSPFDPYRNVEFSRDWNLSAVNTNYSENISELKTGIQNVKNQNLIYQFKYFYKGPAYKGAKNLLDASYDIKNFYLIFSGSYLTADAANFSSAYFKHKAVLSKKFKKITVGISEEQENNKFFAIIPDSITGNSFSFQEYEGFLSSSDSALNKFKISYKKRLDNLPYNGKLKRATNADDFNVLLDFSKNPKNMLKTSMTYRRLHISDTALSNSKPDNIFIGRIEYYVQFLKKVFQSTTYYEVGSGMEEKREYSYLEVPAGQGFYKWTDYNSDGIKQLNEFDIASFKDEATFIRVFTPTRIYIRTNTAVFSEALTIEPSLAWARKTGFKKFISRFALQLSFNVDKKTTEESLLKAYNPFLSNVEDSSLVSTSTQFKSVLFFNKSYQKVGAELSYQKSNSKQVLINGFETRDQYSYSLKIRWNITKKIYSNLMIQAGKKQFLSEYLSSKNFDIVFFETEPKLFYQPGNKYRLSLTYIYTNKRNDIQNNVETAQIHNIGFDFKYNFPGKGTIITKANYINILYTGLENNSLLYEMLNGYKNGQNITWNFTFQRNLGQNLQLDLIYDGRKTASNKMVHVGSVQLRAHF